MLLTECTGRGFANREKAVALFYENKLEEALPLFEELVKQEGKDADAHAWLAETYRRLGRKGDAVKTAGQAIALEPCHSLAHTIMAEACHSIPVGTELFDSDTSWVHITRAVECDSTDGNAWVLLCNDAMIRGKYNVMREAAGKLAETGFVTEAVLAFGRWLLRTLPENAILITNGDMDTYPVMALQATEGLRPDVAVVEKEWLGLRQYLSFIRDRYDISIPVTESHIDSIYRAMDFPENMLSVSGLVFNGWLEMKAEKSLARPVALACTVSEDFYENAKDRFQYAGPFLVWQPAFAVDTPDTTLLRRGLAGIESGDFSGPWVSHRDKSPVRRIYAKYLVRNITYSAIVYSQELINEGQVSEAGRILDWAADFEKKSELGPVFAEEISKLKTQTQGQ